MAKLTLFHSGTKILETELDPSREYTLGRSSSADIVLDSKEMSRQHAKVSFNGTHWTCELISKYGQILVGSTSVKNVDLESEVAFKIPPFDLKFEITSQSKINSPSNLKEVETDSDHTQTGQFNLKAVLFRLDSKGNPVEEFILGEGLIEAGRSRSCQIRLNDEKSSRKHFKMENNGQQVTLTDLGSPNFTYVNSKPVTTHVLESGDEIRVGEEKLKFELLNSSFDHLPVIESSPSINQDRELPFNQPAVIKYATNQRSLETHSSRRRGKKAGSPMFFLVVLAIAGAIIYMALGKDNPSNDNQRHLAGQNEGSKTQNPSPADKYTPEQRKFLDDTYNLAMNLYTSGKYDLAGLETDKILRIDPNYKDAKNIQIYAQQALEIRKQKDDTERRQAEIEANNRKVNDLLDECDKLLSSRHFNDVENCVLKTSDLDPENSRGQNLISAAKQELENIQESKQHKAAQVRRKNDAEAVFSKAQKELALKRYPTAISSFEKLETMNFKDNEGLKQKAHTGIQNAKAKIVESSDAIYREGKASLDAKDYKKAILKLSEALKIYPQNGDAKISREKAASELHIIMKNIYSESVIDENIGNVEPAKKKWKQIIDEDVPFDDYFQKAKMKLGKYEK